MPISKRTMTTSTGRGRVRAPLTLSRKKNRRRATVKAPVQSLAESQEKAVRAGLLQRAAKQARDLVWHFLGLSRIRQADGAGKEAIGG